MKVKAPRARAKPSAAPKKTAVPARKDKGKARERAEVDGENEESGSGEDDYSDDSSEPRLEKKKPTAKKGIDRKRKD